MLVEGPDYDSVYSSHRWDIPEQFNMGVDVCDKHANRTPERTALIIEEEDGGKTTYSFGDLKRLTNKMANLLVAKGVQPGDRVAILLSQSVEAAVSHIAAWKAGFISIPMFTLFGEEALEYRLGNSGARTIVTDLANLPKIEAIRDKLPELEHILIVEPTAEDNSITDLWRALDKASDAFTPVDSGSNNPALIVYTSGTTGNPKGALHAHRTMFGHLPGVEFPHEFFPKPDDLFWTPADWAWIGGLMNVLMSSLHHGVPVLAHRAKKYNPEQALRLMAKHGVRNTFMPPTALKLMRQVENIPANYKLSLRTVTVAGEPMGAELLDWGKEALGVTCNEYYGQTECNLVVANCAKIMEVRPGSMGKAVPGHIVEIIDNDGNLLPANTVGQIAVKAPDPVMMLEYWKNPEATKAKYRGEWLLTGDEGHKDEKGYLWFKGRDDDVITSAGYRIGPSEIEDCLIKHPAVSLAAVIGVPDPIRTESIKAFILPNPGVVPSAMLEGEIRDFVKTRLSPHEYPRLIEFVDGLPLTATGKIKRKDLRDAEIEKQQKT